MIASVWTLAALIAIQAGSAQTSNLPTLTGTIVDAKTAAPIKDARVTLVEASLDVRTAADGRFEFPKIAPKTYTLTVSTIGYIFVKRRVDDDQDVLRRRADGDDPIQLLAANFSSFAGDIEH